MSLDNSPLSYHGPLLTARHLIPQARVALTYYASEVNLARDNLRDPEIPFR